MHLPGYYEYCCRVKIVSGMDALEKLPELLDTLGACRPMLVTDSGVAAAGLIDTVLGATGGRINPAFVADDVPTDSDMGTVSRLAGVYRNKGCDALIAVGGGSVIDTAKGINILVSENGDDLRRYAGAGALRHRLKPLVAVPTTSGTGSEVTLVAVIADRDQNRKVPFTSYFLLPDAAVLDPRMTLTLPAVITAATAMDAMAHAVEAYTCLAKNPLSDGAAVAALGLISRHLLPVVQKPDDAQGRLALANAATLAGMAFSNSMVGMVHTLGHTVGAICRVPHGVCMAILLAYGLEYNLHRNGRLTAQLLLPLAGSETYARTPKHLRTERVIAWIRQLNQDLHDATDGQHPRFFGEVVDRSGQRLVAENQLESIAAHAINDASILYNPEEMDTTDALSVMRAAWEGRPLDGPIVD